MDEKTRAVVLVVGLVVVAAFVHGGGMMVRRVSAQAASFHVIPVTNGSGTCRDMTNDLRVDRDTWRASYFNYMAGFITGANFVSYSVGGRDSNVAFSVPSGGADGVFAALEQYCAQRPTTNVSIAITSVYSQLLAHKQ